MRLTAFEKETVINCNAAENTAYIHSREPRVWHHLQRLGIKPTQEHVNSMGQIYARDYEVPKAWLKLPKPPKRMNFSVEQRQALADRLRRARGKR